MANEAATPTPEEVNARLKSLESNVAAQQSELKALDTHVKNSEAEDVAAQAKEEEDERAKLKSGRYLRFGAGGGVAYSVSFPAPLRLPEPIKGQAEQKSFAGTAMPYVSFFPGYFFGSEANRAFCAAKWNQDDNVAHSVALDISREKAKIIVYQLTALAKSGVNLNTESVKRLIPHTYSGISGEDLDAAIVQVVAKLREFLGKDTSTGTLTPAQEALLIDTLSALHWNPAHRPLCFYRSAGIYLGLPQSYQVSSTLIEKNGDSITAIRSFNPTISVGVVVSPNAYVAILGGLTVGNIPQSTVQDPSDDSTTNNSTTDYTKTELIAGQPQRAFSILVGIGGNINIVELFTKN